MTARPVIVPGAQPSRDANGRNLPALFRFYQPSTTTPATVYTDATLTVPHPFPLPSDSAGRWPPIWADDSQSFDVGWSDQVFDETIRTFTSVSPANDAVLASVAMAQAAADQATAAQAQVEALTETVMAAAIGLKLKGTSASAVNLTDAVVTFHMDQANLDFDIGNTIVGAVTTDAANKNLVGIITAWDGQTMTVAVSSHTGAGNFNAWKVTITPPGGVLSVAGLSGAITAAQLKTALAISSADLTDIIAFRGLIAAMATAL